MRPVRDFLPPQYGTSLHLPHCANGQCTGCLPPIQLVPADHPHTDPGDGRTECEVCGKFVWLVIHSCKGVPVTEVARQRWAERQGGGPDA